MDNDFMFLSNLVLNQEAVNQIIEFNETTSEYGLTLSKNDATELVETRNEALSSNGRIEFGSGIINKIIYEFFDSPFMHQSDYANTLNELVETFYYFKNETLDKLSDDELISLMREYFDERCLGSVEMLKTRELELLAHNIRFGVEDFTNLDEPEEEEFFQEEDEG